VSGASHESGTSEARAERPLPDVSPRMRAFWEAAREGRLVIQECGRCGARRFPAAETCDGCLRGDALGWIEASGRGTVFSYVVMHQVHDRAFGAEVPYAVLDVKLDEGPRMISGLESCAISDLRVGLPVEVTFETRGELSLPRFRPVSPK
jgi:uncharacterized OB-fold protein